MLKVNVKEKKSFGVKIKKLNKIIAKDFTINKSLYFMILPAIIYYTLFHYKPMVGAIMAFKDFKPNLGIWGSPWAGLKHFKSFFESIYFWRILKNTIVINLTDLIWGFPAPIILALLINEVRNNKFKRTVQTVTYLPHFISLVVVCGMIKDFTSDSGVIAYIISLFGGEAKNLLQYPRYFVSIFVSSSIWQHIGWGTIVYLAALTGIDQELYEAAQVDGANRWRQTLSITIPGIMPTIVILLILRVGQLLNVGFEKIILLYNPAIYETADVISSYVYRKGLLEFNYSFSTAVGLFNSIINFALLITANKLSKKFNETSLW